MKLETTLPERPGFLHALPLMDLFALMLMFFMLGPALVQQSGIAVDLPPSQFQMERFRNSLVVTLGNGQDGPSLYFGREPMTSAQLSEELDRLQAEGAAAKSIVLLQTDAATPVGLEREITELVLAKGFRLALVGRTEAAPEPKPAEPLAE
jgi:biopolymer transport protein ExbD